MMPIDEAKATEIARREIEGAFRNKGIDVFIEKLKREHDLTTGRHSIPTEGAVQDLSWVDVRDHGADPGASPRINYVAFQDAIESASTGGMIVFPIGNYGINDELFPYSGQSFLGMGNQPIEGNRQSSRIYQTTDGKHIFSVGELKQDIHICGMTLGARANQTGVPYTGRYGIHCHGSDPNSSHRLYLSRVTFTDFDRAINVEDPNGADYGWALDHVSVRDCLFALNNIGVYFKARNAAAWHFDTCNFLVPTNGSGLELNHVGFIKLTNCIAGGFSINNNTFVKIRGPYCTIKFDTCQAETLYAWLDVAADAQASRDYPIILDACLTDADIYLRQECHFMSKGTRYGANVYIEDTDILVDSIGDNFLAGYDWRVKVDPAYFWFQNRLGFRQNIAASPGNILAGRREVRDTAAPTAGTWRQGDVCWNESPAAGGIPGWICISSGTFSAATDAAGDTDGLTAVITGMADTSDFEIGDYVTVSAGFPTTGPYCIINKTASSITINVNSDSAQSNITIETPDPVWKAMGVLAA